MSVVSLRNLTKAYGNHAPALRDVTLDVPPGVTGLLGPNGAGKSTLIQCVLGLLPDFTGDASVLGMDARRQRRAIRRKVGFMPETDAYLPVMSGIQAVRYLGQLTGLPRSEALRRAHEMLFHVGLGEAIYRSVREYSTGMRQRFKLASALVHDPEVIFLDEPLAGMDPSGRRDLLDLIKDLATAHGKHVLWSSHILPDVEKVADSIVVLHEGRFRGTFQLDELRGRRGMYHVEIEGESDAFITRLTALDVHLKAATEKARALGGDGRSAWTVALPPERGTRAVLQAAHACGVRVRRLSPIAEDLEEVFLRILDEGPAHASAGQEAR